MKIHEIITSLRSHSSFLSKRSLTLEVSMDTGGGRRKKERNEKKEF